MSRGAWPGPFLREAAQTTALLAVVITGRLTFVASRERPDVALISTKSGPCAPNVDTRLYAGRANGAATCKKARTLALRASPSPLAVLYEPPFQAVALGADGLGLPAVRRPLISDRSPTRIRQENGATPV